MALGEKVAGGPDTSADVGAALLRLANSKVALEPSETKAELTAAVAGTYVRFIQNLLVAQLRGPRALPTFLDPSSAYPDVIRRL